MWDFHKWYWTLFYPDHSNPYYRKIVLRRAIRILRNSADDAITKLLSEVAYCTERFASIKESSNLEIRKSDARKNFINLYLPLRSNNQIPKRAVAAIEDVINNLY